MLGYNINIVKIENEDQLDSLDSYLNLLDYNAFLTPAPKGLMFIGGV